LNVIYIYHDDLEFKSLRVGLRSKIYFKTGIFVIELLFCQILVAQPEARLIFIKQDSLRLMRYTLYDHFAVFPLYNSEATLQLRNFNFNYNYFQPLFILDKDPNTAFSFSQSRFVKELPGLGSVEHYFNQIGWNAGSKTKIELGAGLAIQNTIMNLFVPNYQLSFKGVLEYSFNDWISVYMYGQYLTAPINKPDNYFDPFMHNNTLFLQNEVGAGINTTYKKSRIDLQFFSIYDSDFKDMRPVHSKIRIGF
jgi:hypothetical protein